MSIAYTRTHARTHTHTLTIHDVPCCSDPHSLVAFHGNTEDAAGRVMPIQHALSGLAEFLWGEEAKVLILHTIHIQLRQTAAMHTVCMYMYRISLNKRGP